MVGRTAQLPKTCTRARPGNQRRVTETCDDIDILILRWRTYRHRCGCAVPKTIEQELGDVCKMLVSQAAIATASLIGRRREGGRHVGDRIWSKTVGLSYLISRSGTVTIRCHATLLPCHAEADHERVCVCLRLLRGRTGVGCRSLGSDWPRCGCGVAAVMLGARRVSRATRVSSWYSWHGLTLQFRVLLPSKPRQQASELHARGACQVGVTGLHGHSGRSQQIATVPLLKHISKYMNYKYKKNDVCSIRSGPSGTINCMIFCAQGQL